MRLMVTGATGFVGQHLVTELLRRGHEVTAVIRSLDKAREMSWYDRVTVIPHDLCAAAPHPLTAAPSPDCLIHLAWPGLPNYDDLDHIEKSLPLSFSFIKKMVLSGVQHVLVTGTCFEYGMQSGPLSEELPAAPVTAYGIAKNALRQSLEALGKRQPFTLQWARLFYMYGAGQNPRSLMAQVDRAIENKEKVFNMSSGEQLRDYLAVEEVVRRLAGIIERPAYAGIINCCSGRPVSVRRLVEERIAASNSDLKINPGYYPYSENAPLAFWGDPRRLETVLNIR